MDINDIDKCDCGNTKLYSAEYDTYYCEDCNKWLEDTCSDRNCHFCNNRPLFPNDQFEPKPLP